MITQIAALKLAIKIVAQHRQKYYSVGNSAFHKGIDFDFATKAHTHYTECSETIRQLEDLIEIISDPGATVEPEEQQGRLP